MAVQAQSMTKLSRGARVALVGAESIVGLTAIGGGIALVTGPESSRYPLALLDGTPFSSYVVPGVILAIVVGGSAAAAAVLTLRDLRLGAIFSSTTGAILMGWIVGEVLLLNEPSVRSWVEAFYFILGALMVGLGLVLGRGGRRHGSGN